MQNVTVVFTAFVERCGVWLLEAAIPALNLPTRPQPGHLARMCDDDRRLVELWLVTTRLDWLGFLQYTLPMPRLVMANAFLP